MEQLGIEIHLGTEIGDVSRFGTDQVIVATGAAPIVLRGIQGHERMIEAIDFLLGNETVGERVAVVGGGLTGCEIAYELALQGKHPVIIEMKNDLVAQKGVCLANSSYLREWFALHGVPIHLETTLTAVHEDKVVCRDKDGRTVEIPCDSVISSVGYVPRPLAGKGRNIHFVGDCKQVGNVKTVIWGAYEAAMKI